MSDQQITILDRMVENVINRFEYKIDALKNNRSKAEQTNTSTLHNLDSPFSLPKQDLTSRNRQE